MMNKFIVPFLVFRTRRVFPVALVIFVCTCCLIVVRHNSVEKRMSPKIVKVLDLKKRVFSPTNTTSGPWFHISTHSPLDKDKEIRRMFDTRLKVTGHKSDKPHPHLRKLLISSEDVCRGRSVDLLIYFHSAWNNFQKRRLLRETWASENIFHNLTIRTIFFLGKSNFSGDQKKIRNEAASYGDIVQGDFLDTFQNLSLKVVTCLKWINDNCMNAKYVIKADDDIFVNVFKVVENIIPMLSSKKLTVACHFKNSGKSVIVRDPKSKWFVSKDIFPDHKYYPEFCSGYAAIFTIDIIPKMYEASFRAPFISIDDVYMFGLLPQFFKTLKYIDIKRNCTLNNKVALNQYTHPTPTITYVVANTWENNMHVYWLSALSKLSPWASRQAQITNLRQNKGPASKL